MKKKWTKVAFALSALLFVLWWALGTGATAMSRKGTYNYMSPEIYSNQKADIRADMSDRKCAGL